MSAIASPTLRPGGLKVAVEEIKARRGPAPWSERIVVNDQFAVTVICQAPGHRNDWHYHVVQECWYVHEGELSWTMEGEAEPITAGAGEWILAPANAFHLIQVLGDRPAIRVAVSVAGEPHRHERENRPPTPPGARA
jgi:quercetin dioxygenase-like cupin family protein